MGCTASSPANAGDTQTTSPALAPSPAEVKKAQSESLPCWLRVACCVKGVHMTRQNLFVDCVTTPASSGHTCVFEGAVPLDVEPPGSIKAVPASAAAVQDTPPVQMTAPTAGAAALPAGSAAKSRKTRARRLSYVQGPTDTDGSATSQLDLSPVRTRINLLRALSCLPALDMDVSGHDSCTLNLSVPT